MKGGRKEIPQFGSFEVLQFELSWISGIRDIGPIYIDIVGIVHMASVLADRNIFI